VEVCNGFPEHYRQTLSIPIADESRLQQELNRFSIARTAFNSEDQRPYVPGSSVKGSLRTGYLNELQKKERLPASKGKGAAQDLERRLMGYDSIPSDPFRLVKVSDFRPVGETRTKVLYAINEKKKPSKFSARGPVQVLEVILPGSVFVGTITVDRPEVGANIRNPVSMESLLDSASKFYLGERARENKELSQVGIAQNAPEMDPHALDGGLLLRIGRHSGAESVTIDGQRQILIRQERGKNLTLEQATTFWLASESRKPKTKQQLLPYGWAVLAPLANDLSDHFLDEEELWKNRAAEEKKARESLLQKIALEKREALEAARKKAEEEERKRVQEEERKAKLAAMSPEEREVALLSAPSVTEDQMVKVFLRLDQFSEPNRKLAADALKDYWLKAGKWAKKDCSKKQWVKVQKIKSILGES
jgi:CRISPR-associated protein Csm5